MLRRIGVADDAEARALRCLRPCVGRRMDERPECSVQLLARAGNSQARPIDGGGSPGFGSLQWAFRLVQRAHDADEWRRVITA